MATKKAPIPKNFDLTIGYNEARNFLVTNEDARGSSAWKMDFTKLLGTNAPLFSGLKPFSVSSEGTVNLTPDRHSCRKCCPQASPDQPTMAAPVASRQAAKAQSRATRYSLAERR